MFKKKFTAILVFPIRRPVLNRLAAMPFFLVFIICFAGCQIFPRLPPANLSEAGWVVRQGQAVWRAKRGAPEIAGEILVATQPDGRALVQFTKTPIPFLAGQITSNAWQIHSVPDDKTYSGHGRPPVRAIFLWLPQGLKGLPVPPPLIWKAEENQGWRLENLKTGEYLEGYLNP